jgi:four helix bundle protein
VTEGKLRTHKDLLVWQKAVDLVLDVYKITQSFPKEEGYGLTSQIRRAAISVPSNLAEGAARQTKKEFQQFIYIAMGSVAELETQLIIADRLGYLNSQKNVTVTRYSKGI